MRLSRFYTPQPLSLHQSVTIEERPSHYMLRVLRLQIGDQVILFNGDGNEYSGVIEDTKSKRALVMIQQIESKNNESPLWIELGQGISKGERMDFVIQKSIELGVNLITPLWTQRSQSRLKGERMHKRQLHWQGIVHSSCEQSGRVIVPELSQDQTLLDWCSINNNTDLNLVLNPLSSRRLNDLPRCARVRLLIGPEGGLNNEEISHAEDSGFVSVGLGPRVLRTETAALATISALQLLWGDFGNR